MKLRGKTALVTGAGRNIGKAIACAFAAEGADLIVSAHTNEAELQATVTECERLGARALPILADVANPSDVERLVGRGLDHYGQLDVLVSTVGLRPHTPFVDLSIDEWHQVLEVNLSATFYLCKQVVPSMIERRSGSIIALGGLTALTGMSNAVAGSVSKTGLLGLIRALAAELGPYGIRANMVVPSGVDTERRNPEWYAHLPSGTAIDQNAFEKIPLGRLGRPEEVASVCAFLASDESSYVTGDRILCMGGRFMG
jgi:3-oxoacyl-[acyl-carrier protein] reductase